MQDPNFTAFENRTMNDLNIQKELLELSEEVFAEYHKELIEAFENNNVTKIKAIAHKAKTGALILGMTQLSASYENIEKQITDTSNNYFNKVFIEELIKNFNLAIVKLKKYINSKTI